jgi:pimeloyl-ACP methyl ester carboxylesterase
MPNAWTSATQFCSFTARPASPATPSSKDNQLVSLTRLDNAVPEGPYDASRVIEPILTADGQPRVRARYADFTGGLPSDYFPNAARDAASALRRHADEAEQMAHAERKRKDEEARAAAKAEEEKRLAALKPHPRAVRPNPADHPAFWIWCENDGTFKYVYTTYGRFASEFTPGVSFVDEQGRFDPSPANIALWAKLAFEAGRDVAANSAKYQW